MKAVRRIFAVIIGMVFAVAGLLKLMDPVGAGLVMEEYFKFLHLPFMLPAARVLGTAAALLESLVGAALITGVWRRLTGAVTGVMMAGFTLLTLVLWIKNPVMECGCFGEAIHLTHLQSLVKNCILLVFWAIAFVPFRLCGEPLKIKYVSFSLAAISMLLFTLYSSLSIPLMDFTAYQPGVELQQSIDVEDDDAPLLSLSDADGDYRDDLVAEGNVLVMSVPDPHRLGRQAQERISRELEATSGLGMTPLLLMGCRPEDMDDMDLTDVIKMHSYFADRRELLTLNRSNGGATLIMDGQIVSKWAARSLPDAETLEMMSGMEPSDAMIESTAPGRLGMQGFLLYVFAVMLLL